MRMIYTTILCIPIFFYGCKSTSTEPLQSMPENFHELTADDSFGWSTTKTVTVTVQGFETVNPVSRALIISDAGGSVLYKQAMILSDTQDIVLTIPSVTTSLKFKYGSIERSADISGLTALVNLATPDDYQY